MHHTKERSHRRASVMWTLLAMYVATVVIRYGLALLVTRYPTMMIDEFLYYSMGRSIATEGSLLYMGQCADYAFFLYPLVIAPIYWLMPEGGPILQAIQLWNILLMSTSIFPLYSLCKAISKSHKNALWATVVLLFLPDMLLGGQVLSECLIYPLTYCLLLCAWKAIGEEQSGYLPVSGVLGGLIYFVKPGHFVSFAVVWVAALIIGIRKKRAKAIIAAVGSLLAAAATIAALYLVAAKAFDLPFSLFSIYSLQMEIGENLHLGVFLESVLLSPYYLLLGCAILPLLLPLCHRTDYPQNQRLFFDIVCGIVAAIMVGTAWVVNRVEYGTIIVHTRYFAMYIPVLTLYCFMLQTSDLRKSQRTGKEQKWIPLIIGGYMALSAVAALLFEKPSAQKGMFLNLISTIFYRNHGIRMTLLVLALTALSLLFAWKLRPQALKKAAGFALLTVLLLNNVAPYSHFYTKIDTEIIQDNEEIVEALCDKDYLYVFGSIYSIRNLYMDIRTKRNISMVYINDLFNQMSLEEGVYQPFVPASTRGIIPDRETPDTVYLLLDDISFAHIDLAPAAKVLCRAENGLLYLIEIPKGERWLNSILGGTENAHLSCGTTAYIRLFGELAETPCDVTIDLDLPMDCDVIIGDETEPLLFSLPAGRDEYTIHLPDATSDVSIVCFDCDISIYGYRVE